MRGVHGDVSRGVHGDVWGVGMGRAVMWLPITTPQRCVSHCLVLVASRTNNAMFKNIGTVLEC